MNRPLHFGVQLGTSGVTWSELFEAAQRVEALGYDSLWLPDHLIAREGDVPRLEAWEALAALATVTTRVRVGPLVSPVTFRHPAVLAKMAVTLDHISAGRAILGLGAGGMVEEHRQFGLHLDTARERTERLEEAALLIRSLLEGTISDFAGKYYGARGARALPKPVQPRMPFLIAGMGQGVVRIAAQLADIWNGIGLPPAISAKVHELRQQISAAGRDPASVMATASFRLIIRDGEDAIARRINELDPSWHEDPYRIVGDVPTVVRQLRAYVRAGVHGLIVQMPAPFDLRTLEQLAGDVRPSLRVAGPS